MLRAVLLGIVGIATFLFPEFLLNGMVYVIAMYAILNGALSIADYFLHGRDDKKATSYVNIAIACLLIVFGNLSVIYYRYLVSILPVLLGGLMMIESIVYFVIALCPVTKTKLLLIILAVFIMIGGIVANIFTFGFGGVLTLSQIFGTLLLLSCVYELVVCLINRKAVK
jgi:uncharacterized membrane protein HdeD (DUF308 family)